MPYFQTPASNSASTKPTLTHIMATVCGESTNVVSKPRNRRDRLAGLAVAMHAYSTG